MHNVYNAIFIFSRSHVSIYWTYTAVIHALMPMLYAIYIIQYMVCIVKHQVILYMQFYAAQSWKALLSCCIPKVHKWGCQNQNCTPVHILGALTALSNHWLLRRALVSPRAGLECGSGGRGEWKQGAEKMETIPNHKRGKFDTALINELRQTIQSGHFGVVVHE